MSSREEIPEFLPVFVEASQAIQYGDKDSQTRYYTLFVALEILVLEALTRLEVKEEYTWTPELMRQVARERRLTLGRIVHELGKHGVMPAGLYDSLRGLVEHRNILAHGEFRDRGLAEDVLIEDHRTVRRIAIWYLVEFSVGPKINIGLAGKLLDGGKVSSPRKSVFISYAKEDGVRALALYRALLERGHKPWMDKQDLLAGQDWELEIRNAIQRSDFFVALMSSTSVTKRGFVQKEIRYALDVLGEIPPGGIYFVPVRLERCTVPDAVKRLHWIDLQDDSSYDEVFRVLEHERSDR